jgi:hypothetical protein
MSCYQCGSTRHKKRDCPNRIASIKCYECGKCGHYKNDCPIVVENARIASEQQKKESNEKWIHDVLPDMSRTLANKEDLIVFCQDIEKSDRNYGYLSCQFGAVKLTVKDNNVSFKLENNVTNDRKWMCYDLTVCKFLEFIEIKGLGSYLKYCKRKDGLESVVHELHRANIVDVVYWDRKKYGCDYYYNDIKIMSEWDERGMEYKIYAGTLICELYDNYKDNGRSIYEDLKEIQIKIIFK